jgi:hypothetical protein
LKSVNGKIKHDSRAAARKRASKTVRGKIGLKLSLSTKNEVFNLFLNAVYNVLENNQDEER